MATLDRLTPFESYMFFEQRDHQPMSFFLRVRLEGSPDVGMLRASLTRVARQHPLLSAKVTRDAKDRLCWVEDSDSSVRLSVEPECDPLNAEVIDLESSSGLRVWLTGCAPEYVLWLQVHHACCDGLGLLAFLRNWQSEVEKSDSPTKRERCRINRRGVQNLGMLTWRQAWRLARFSLRRHVRPIGDQTINTVAHRGFAVRELSLPCPSTRPRTVDGRSPTVNDVLIASSFLAFGQALQHNTSEPRQELLRLCVPVNLRPYSAEPQAVANCVSMSFLDRRLDQVGDMQELLAGVCCEMNYVKRHRIGLSMLHVLRAFGSRLRVPEGRCMASAVLSNMGRLDLPDERDWEFGGARVTGVDLLPPLRQYTNLALGVTSLSDKLRLAMHYNTAAIQRPFAEVILDRLADQVEESLGATSVPAG